MECKYFKGKQANEVIDVQVDMILYWSVTEGLPQGDPAAGNDVRLTADMKAIVTSQGIKHKIRSGLKLRHNASMLIERGAILDQRVQTLIEECTGKPVKAAKGKKPKGKKTEEGTADAESSSVDNNESNQKVDVQLERQVAEAAAKAYMDVALFGGLLALSGNINVGVRGPVQIGFSKSLHAVDPVRWTITRQCDQNESKTTMGSMETVPFALFATPISVSAYEAEKLGTTWGQLDQMVDVMTYMFQDTKSAIRFGGAFERLMIFQHTEKGGNVASEAIFRTYQPRLRTAIPQSGDNYEFPDVAIDGVEVTPLTLDGLNPIQVTFKSELAAAAE